MKVETKEVELVPFGDLTPGQPCIFNNRFVIVSEELGNTCRWVNCFYPDDGTYGLISANTLVEPTPQAKIVVGLDNK